jgi:hypothetical protein
LEQRAHGIEVWRDPLIAQRAPKIFDLHADPFERADIESGAYDRWFIDRAYMLVPAQAVVAQFPGDLPGVSAAPKTRIVRRRSGARSHAEGI